MDKNVKTLIVDSNVCNDQCYTVFNLSSFTNLKVFEVGDYSFTYVNEVRLIGLKHLERVVIGENSFTKKKISGGHDPARHFYVKNCKKLRELKIGYYSFSDYSVCEIENVPSLEVIEMGGMDRDSINFLYSSLELKSENDGIN